MKTGRPRERGSINAEGGRAMLGVSKKTRERINRLAHNADMPVSEYIKKLIEKTAERNPVSVAASIDIIDQLVDKNERMEAEMKALEERYAQDYSKIELALGRIYRKLTGSDPGIRKTIKGAVAKPKQSEAENNG